MQTRYDTQNFTITDIQIALEFLCYRMKLHNESLGHLRWD